MSERWVLAHRALGADAWAEGDCRPHVTPVSGRTGGLGRGPTLSKGPAKEPRRPPETRLKGSAHFNQWTAQAVSSHGKKKKKIKK